MEHAPNEPIPGICLNTCIGPICVRVCQRLIRQEINKLFVFWFHFLRLPDVLSLVDLISSEGREQNSFQSFLAMFRFPNVSEVYHELILMQHFQFGSYSRQWIWLVLEKLVSTQNHPLTSRQPWAMLNKIEKRVGFLFKGAFTNHYLTVTIVIVTVLLGHTSCEIIS